MKPKTAVIILVVVFLVLLILGKAQRSKNVQPIIPPSASTTIQEGTAIPNTGGPIDDTLSSLDSLVNSSNPEDFSADTLSGLE